MLNNIMAAIKEKVSSFLKSLPETLSSLSRNKKIALAALGSYLLYRSVKSFLQRPKSLLNQIAFITGAGDGIGRSLALDLAKAGAKIVIADIDKTKAEAVANEILGNGGEAIAVYCDVASVESVKQAASTARTAFGDPTILISNAGICISKPIVEHSIEDFEKTLKINTFAHFYTIHEFLPSMIEKKEGHVVAIASMTGMIGARNMTAYSASKFAVVGLTESLRKELKFNHSNVKTTIICPTFVKTNMTKFLPSSIKMMDVEYVSARIIRAIQYSEEVVILPWSMRFIHTCIRPLLSTSSFDSFFLHLRKPMLKEATR
jgi:all-trans-retinol dehydrogenase (NAD+)